MDRLDRLVAEVRKIVAKRPEVSYGGACSYDTGECSDGTVGCLLGQALDAIDWGLYPEDSGDLIVDLLDEAGYEDFRVSWCGMVQEKQDMSAAWGECVEYADGPKTFDFNES